MGCGCGGSTAPQVGATIVDQKTGKPIAYPAGGPGEPGYTWNGPVRAITEPAQPVPAATA